MLIFLWIFVQLNTVWLSCEGENPADIENIGQIEYYPRQGFPGYYFPYENSEGYLSPLVAIHFTKPTRKLTLFLVHKNETDLWHFLFFPA